MVGVLKRPAGLVEENTVKSLKKARLSPTEDDDYNDAPDEDQMDVDEEEEVKPKPKKKGAKNSEKLYKCEFEGCTSTFNRPSKLEVHMAVHTGDRPFTCDEPGCNKSFKRKEHLTEHCKGAHTQGDDKTCIWRIIDDNGNEVECGKTFNNQGKLNRHVKVHEAKEELTCKEKGCGKSFRKQKTLDAHVAADHRGEDAYVCRSIVIGAKGEETACGKVYATSSGLRVHEDREHVGYTCPLCAMQDDDAQSSIMAPSTPSESPLPEGTVMTYAELKLHLRRAHPPMCPECGKQLKSVRGYNKHMKLHEQGVDPDKAKLKFVCDWPECGKRFAHSGNLATHKRNVHEKKRNFVCGEFDMSENAKTAGWNGKGCGMALATKGALERHVQSIHLGIPQKKWRPKTKIKSEDGESESMSTAMDLPEAETPVDNDMSAVAMLTGHGYEQVKKIPCLEKGCKIRFAYKTDLVNHVELTHDWNIDDINDAIFEREALNGGDFWLGGIDPAVDEGRKHAEAVRSQLEDRLRIGQIDAQSTMLDPNSKTVNEVGIRVVEGEEMQIDPELV